MWSTTIPTEPGTYWFYGDEIAGAMGVDYTDQYKWEPRMSLVDVRKCANGFIAVANGNFMPMRKFRKDGRSEGHLGYWTKAELPTPPFDSENYGDA